MPPARFAALLAVVLAAAALTVGLAALAAPAGISAEWMLLPLLAAAASIFWRRS
ncbi:MAG: hypothetical protein LCH69_10795 [Proteobacteria bacterium]|nr:hypothetical protein [Pseudomonadota bacterium]